ncbi:MAG: hypothetical protein ABI885_27290 [Gammaproteobacteria bacterium]
MALIAVLWLIAVLTLLATTAATVSVSHRRAAQRYAQSVQLDSVADSAIRITLLRLIAPPQGVGRVRAGQSVRMILAGGDVDCQMELEAGLLDLNLADPELIYAVFAANGWPEKRARAMANRIEDWKDADDVPREQGAERREYLAAGLSFSPRNGPFESVEELLQVFGAGDIDDSLFAAFTVFTHAGAPAAGVAPPVVQRALELADDRQLGGHRWLLSRGDNTSAGVAASSSSSATSHIGEVVRLEACARRGNFERCRKSVVRLTGSTRKPLQIFEWRSYVPVVSRSNRQSPR